MLIIRKIIPSPFLLNLARISLGNLQKGVEKQVRIWYDTVRNQRYYFYILRGELRWIYRKVVHD